MYDRVRVSVDNVAGLVTLVVGCKVTRIYQYRDNVSLALLVVLSFTSSGNKYQVSVVGVRG